ncbi:MAG: cytochrome b/b6 domain-containing protein [Proteobacteria bacterium]|nr:cytochrome b/b6 domain-containing protein [Pseudomonadota bacterium]
MATDRIKRFSVIDRLFHLSLMLTFIIQAATGFARVYQATAWGKSLSHALGGYDTCMTIHKTVGLVMIAGFMLHTLILIFRIDWKNPVKSLLGPDSLVPNIQDLKHLKERILWSVGLGKAPSFDRWAYFEKFDYWAVYWGIPLLAITGLMAMYPLTTCRILPGWALNISALLHRAEAILAVTYVFIVHFFVGHLRPMSFPMNEAMFAGSVPMEELLEEKPVWLKRLKHEGKHEGMKAGTPLLWFRVIYLIFGFTALSTGIYILINGIIYSRSINLH